MVYHLTHYMTKVRKCVLDAPSILNDNKGLSMVGGIPHNAVPLGI